MLDCPKEKSSSIRSSDNVKVVLLDDGTTLEIPPGHEAECDTSTGKYNIVPILGTIPKTDISTPVQK